MYHCPSRSVALEPLELTVADTSRASPSGGSGRLIDSQSILVNIVAGKTDVLSVAQTSTWGEIHSELLAKPFELRDAKDGAGWMPVSLRHQDTGRRADNVDKVYCLVLDIDHGMSFDDAARRLHAHGYEAALHTSFSHSEAEDRFRVVLPLDKPATPEQAKCLFLMMQKLFDGKVDSACSDASRFFYLPACPASRCGLFRAQHISGRALSLEDAVARSVASAYGGASGTAVESAQSNDAGTGAPTMASVLPPVPVGQRNEMLAKLVGGFIAKGKTLDQTRHLVMVWNATRLTEPLPIAEVERTVQSVYKTAQRKAALRSVQLDEAIAEMNKKYAFLTEPSIVVDIQTCTKQTPEMMRARYSNALVTIEDGGRMKQITHYDAWSKSKDRREHLGLTFEPGKGLIVDDRVNTWRRWPATRHAAQGQRVPIAARATLRAAWRSRSPRLRASACRGYASRKAQARQATAVPRPRSTLGRAPLVRPAYAPRPPGSGSGSPTLSERGSRSRRAPPSLESL